MAKSLGVEAVIRLFKLSARRDRGRGAAVTVLAGSIARYSHDPDHWQDRDERELALSLISARGWKLIGRQCKSSGLIGRR
jgi:hypothetical protein